MADQNCAHAGCSCKVEQGKGVSRGGTIAVISARMLAHLVQENVNVVIRIAGRIRGMAEEIRHPSL
jgi:hypothetical protein